MALELDARNTQSLARLRVVGVVVLCVGLLVLFYGIHLKSLVPDVSSEDFLVGRVSIDQIGRRNEADFSAIGTIMGAGLVSFVGLILILNSSRRLMRLNAVPLEYGAEAVGRGLRRGMAEDANAPTGDVDARLAKLEELRTKRLVSEDEYAAKRSEILASL